MKISLPLALVALALSGCPQPLTADPLPPNPKILSFTASKEVVVSGEHVTLSWSTQDATTVTVERVGEGELLSSPGTDGTFDVTVTEPSLYVFRAKNVRNATDTAMVLVRLAGSEADLTLAALPSTITSGQSSTLTWSAPGATTITLTAVPGGTIDTGAQLTRGSVSVSPAQTTSYLLTAGTRSAMTTVTVGPAVLELSATPNSVYPGGLVRIHWRTTGATTAKLTRSGAGVVKDVMDAAEVADGHYDFTAPATIDPSALFEFELTATGDGAPVKRRLVVPVTGSPYIDTFTIPAAVRDVPDAGAVEVSWTTAGADQVALEREGVEIYRTRSSTQAVSGSVNIASPHIDTVYTLKAIASRGGQVSSSRKIEVRGVPTVTLTPSVTSPVNAGAPFSLAWSGTFIHGAKITDSRGNLLFASPEAGDTGTLPRLAINGDTTWRMEVDNGLGDRASATVTLSATGTKRLTQVETGPLQQGQLAHASFSFGNESPPLLGIPSRSPLRFVTNFDDISGLGTPLLFPNSDNSFAPILTDFRMPFFGQIVGARINVSTNGYLTFGESMNPNNIVVANMSIPSSMLEPMSIAVCWADLQLVNGRVEWLVKPAGTGQVLIVQWTDVQRPPSVGVNIRAQVRMYSTGQIDLEYQSVPGTGQMRSGLQGPRADDGFTYPMAAPQNNTGITFNAPQASPASFRVTHDEPLTFFYENGGALVPIEHDPGVVLSPADLHFAEAMVAPDSRIGRDGTWFELRNTTDRAVDLQGWSLFSPRDGGAFDLAGVVPARGTMVLGTNSNGALNDDAGVSLELPATFDFTRDGGGGLALGRPGTTTWEFSTDGGGGVNVIAAAPMTKFDWVSTLLTPGTSVVEDLGPFRSNVSTQDAVERCGATVGYGSLFPRQRGSPGVDQFCTVPYEFRETKNGYFDIEQTGQRVAMSDPDTGFGQVSFTSAPVPFVGVPRTAARVSTNGFLTFDLVSPNFDFAFALRPTDVTLVLALFADDLAARRPDAAVYVQRVAANVDPFASAPHWIVQWTHWSSTQALVPEDLNFQAKLFDDGAIEYHYGPLISGTDSACHYSGRYATVMVAPSGAQTLMISLQRPTISAKAAYRIYPR